MVTIQEYVFGVIGATKNETTLYLALVGRPHTTVRQMARLTGMKESTVRDNLKSLVRKRMASCRRMKRNNQRIAQFIAADRSEVLKRI